MTLFVSVLMAVSHLYLGWRLTKATGFISGNKLIHKWPWVLLASFYVLPVTGLLIYGITGRLDVLELPKYMVYWFWFGFIFSIQLANGVLVLDILKVFFVWKGYPERTKLNRLYGKLVLVMTAVLFVFTGVKMYLDTTSVETERIELTVEQWPENLNGFRLVHISDLQADQYTGTEEIARYVEEVNALKPDVVVFTGDLISYGTDYIRRSAEEFGKVRAAYGTYAVVGDHDYWAGLSNVEPALQERGIPLLRNENRYIKAGSDSLLLTGITQVYSKRAEPEEVRALTSDSSGVALKILASHQISGVLLGEARQNNYDLLLAGHTHGGQVRIPFFGMTFSASDLETPYVSGPYRRGNLLINVNNGLGFTLAPVRYNARPTVTVIEVKGDG